MIIYKITNLINNKVYIGLTTCSLEYRWKRHLTESRNLNNRKHLYKAIRKYGENKFIIQVIAETDNFQLLGELERYYIKLYNSTDPNNGYNLTAGGERNQYDGNPSAKLTKEEVIQIREIYSMCELSVNECWQMFKNKISFSGFQKIWDGTTWQGIMPEVYTKENIKKHKKQSARLGSKNGNSLYSDEEVLEIRKYYVNHTLEETYRKYGNKSNSKVSFRQVLDKTYNYLPMYSKIKKKWFLNKKEIDINNY